MLVGHFCENRESSVTGNVTELPQAFDLLISPWRLIPI